MLKFISRKKLYQYKKWCWVKNQRGIATLEIMIALVLIILSITAVAPLVFVGQSTYVDTNTTDEGVYLAQRALEDARAKGRAHFADLMSSSDSETVDGIVYDKDTEVTVDPDDPFKKWVTATVSWTEQGRSQETKLTTLVASWQSALRGDECQAPSESNWANPKVFNSAASTTDDLHSGNTLTSLAVKKQHVFITASGQDNLVLGAGHNFYSIDVSNPSSPAINKSTALIGYELNAVSISGDYAYVMGFNHMPFGKVGEEQGDVYYQNGYAYVGIKHGQTIANGQFYIIDISNADNPSVVSGSKINLPSDPKIPVAHASDEFMIFDVHDIHNPTFVGGIANQGIFGVKGINSIQIYNDFAVIGTENDYLVVVDITDKSTPSMSLATSYNAGSHVYGLSINNKGRILAGNKGDLMMLDATGLPSSAISEVDRQNVLGGNQKISGLMGSGDYAFLGIQDPTATFAVAKVAENGTFIAPIPWSVPLAFGGNGAPNGGLSCAGNLVYLGLYPSSNDVLKIIGPGPGAKISISPISSNKLPGSSQVLTAHVEINPSSGYVNAPDGTTINFTETGSATPNSGSCTTSGGSGSCTFTISSATTGSSTVNATATLIVSGTSFTRTTDGTGSNSGPAAVSWKYAPTLANQIHNSSHADITNTTLTSDATIHDWTKVTGSGPTPPTDNVVFTFFSNTNCSGTGSAAGSKGIGAGGIAHPSSNENLSVSGPYSFNAHYNGDANYAAADTCATVALQKQTPTVATQIHNSAHAVITTIVKNNDVHDSATVSGSAGMPTGNVDFTWFTNGTCTGGSGAGNKNLNASGVADGSGNKKPTTAGQYSFRTSYNGDTKYDPQDGPCEVLTVTN